MWLVFSLLKTNDIPCIISVHDVFSTFFGNRFHLVYILGKRTMEFPGRYIVTIEILLISDSKDQVEDMVVVSTMFNAYSRTSNRFQSSPPHRCMCSSPLYWCSLHSHRTCPDSRHTHLRLKRSFSSNQN